MTTKYQETILLSVIIPTFGRLHLLHDCLGSFRRLKCAFEIIIVDDGSNPPICVGASEYNFPVRIIRHTENLGRFEAIKSGAALASGAYIMLFDSDDLWIENRVFELAMTTLCGEAGIIFFTNKTFNKSRLGRFATNYFSIRYKSDIHGDLKEVVLASRFKKTLEQLASVVARRVPTTLIWSLAYSQQRVSLFPHIVCFKQYLSDGMTKKSLKSRLLDSYPMYLLYIQLIKSAFEAKDWMLLFKFGARLVFYRMVSVMKCCI